MADTIARSEADRLPWLTDDIQRRPKRSSGWVGAFLAASIVAIIAALSFWLGMNGLPKGLSLPSSQSPDVRMDVPPAEPEAVQEEIMPEVMPAPVPGPVTLPMESEVRPSTAVAPPVRRVMRERVTIHRAGQRPKAVVVKEQAEPEKKSLEFSNPWESAGASGKMVRVGTYSSLSQGKQAWSRLARVYPAMKRMPAVVTDIPSLRNGKTYYRLQIGTTSQAHSEVLCQRMRTIGQSCVVVDVDGARKGSGDDGQPTGL